MEKIKYLKIVSCLIILLVLCFSRFGFAQQGSAKSLWLETDRFDPAALDVATYNVIVSKQFIDKNNNAFYADPSGESRLNSITVNQGLYFDNTDPSSMMIMSNGGAWAVNFEDFSGDAGLKNIRANKFVMTGLTPGIGIKDEGHFVYDIAEGISVETGDICDVVVIDKYKDMSVTRSTVKFDSKVAGVISEDPKLYMGKDSENKPLALAGIVKCNVNTENGPIKRGDILVTSSEPGYAMKADENQVLPGMVVGSALDALEQGKGKIYILIN
jgi:hypothetical protein